MDQALEKTCLFEYFESYDLERFRDVSNADEEVRIPSVDVDNAIVVVTDNTKEATRCFQAESIEPRKDLKLNVERKRRKLHFIG